VIKPEYDEGKNGPPHASDLRGEIFSLHCEIIGQAYEPVAFDAAEEDLVEPWHHLLFGTYEMTSSR
jgi:hypothetical protein